MGVLVHAQQITPEDYVFRVNCLF